MGWITDYGHPERAFFFSKIRNFWAWADKLGRGFMRHLGYVWPNYRHCFGAVKGDILYPDSSHITFE